MAVPQSSAGYARENVCVGAAALAAVAVLAWLAFGPGPKYEEGWGVLLMIVVVGGLALCATAISPNKWFNSLFFPTVFAAGFLVTFGRMWSMYDGKLRLGEAGLVLLGVVASSGALMALNALSSLLWRRLSGNADTS